MQNDVLARVASLPQMPMPELSTLWKELFQSDAPKYNKPYLVKRVASNGGVLHYLPMDGFCDDIALDAPVLAKRVASNAGIRGSARSWS